MTSSTLSTSNQPKRERTYSEENVNRILIGVTGGSAAGKTTLCENIQKLMSFDANFNVLLIPLDSFYKPLDKTKQKPEDYNFDSPAALDFDMAYDVLKALLRGD
jgi:uridine kinase